MEIFKSASQQFVGDLARLLYKQVTWRTQVDDILMFFFSFFFFVIFTKRLYQFRSSITDLIGQLNVVPNSNHPGLRFVVYCILITPFAVHLRKIYNHLRQQLRL